MEKEPDKETKEPQEPLEPQEELELRCVVTHDSSTKEVKTGVSLFEKKDKQGLESKHPKKPKSKTQHPPRKRFTRKELLEKIDDCNDMIVKNYLEKNTTLTDIWYTNLFGFLLERASYYLDLGEHVYAIIDFELAVELQTEYKPSVEALLLLVTSLFETFCKLFWMDEAQRWCVQIKDLFGSINTPDKDGKKRKKEWERLFNNLTKQHEKVLIPNENNEKLKEFEKKADEEIKKYGSTLKKELENDIRNKIISEMLYQNKLESYKGTVGHLDDIFIKKALMLKHYSDKNIRVFDSAHGIGIKARKNFKKGDILFEDKPVIACFDRQHCGWCGGEFGQKHLVCEECGEKYCSKQCQKDAWKDHHRFEHLIFKDSVLPTEGNDEKVFFLEHLKIQAWEILDVSAIVLGPLFVKFVSKFCMNSKEYPEKDPFSMELFKYFHIGDYTKIKSYDEATNVLKTYSIHTSNLYRHYSNFRLLLTYGHDWCKYPHIDGHIFLKFAKMAFNNIFLQKTYGRCVLFERISFLNHSCMPNVGIGFKNRVGKVVAVKNIKVGEELLYSYVNPKAHVVDRQKAFHMYGFCCACRKCAFEIKREIKKRKKRVKKKKK
jgi:hypothetical protein